MGNYTREEVLQMAEDEDVEFIRLQFTDMFGTLKNIAITARELPRALDNEYVVDSSYIAGIAGEKEPDMYLHPFSSMKSGKSSVHRPTRWPPTMCLKPSKPFAAMAAVCWLPRRI